MIALARKLLFKDMLYIHDMLLRISEIPYGNILLFFSIVSLYFISIHPHKTD